MTQLQDVCNISKDLEQQLTKKLKDKSFALHIDQATDINDHLSVAYFCFASSESLCNDLLFCKYVPSRATAAVLLRPPDSDWIEHRLEWENYVGIARMVHRLLQRKGRDCKK